MKRTAVILFTLLVLLGAGGTRTQAGEKATLGMMDLTLVGVTIDEGILVNEQLLTEITKAERYQVIERARRNEMLKEMGFSQSGLVDDKYLLQAGKYLSAQKMVGGSVGRIGKTWAINVRVLDVATGRVERVANQKFDGTLQELLTVLKDIAGYLVGAKASLVDQGKLNSLAGREKIAFWTTVGLAGVTAGSWGLAEYDYSNYKKASSDGDIGRYQDRTRTDDNIKYALTGVTAVSIATWLLFRRSKNNYLRSGLAPSRHGALKPQPGLIYTWRF